MIMWMIFCRLFIFFPLQALAKDKLFPFIGIFGKGYGKGGEPRPGYILTFVICVGMSCIGNTWILNVNDSIN